MKKLLSLIPLLFLFISGCGDGAITEPENPYGKIYFEPDFVFIGSAFEPLYLNLESEKTFGGVGQSLDIRESIDSSVIEIHIAGLKENGAALEDAQPARAGVNLDSLKGVYTLSIIGFNYNDFYTITIGDTIASISGDATRYTEPKKRITTYSDHDNYER